MLKIDGHTHTELCPHGSGESTSQMIERAIQLGFDEYHITEHAPLPEGFADHYSGMADNWQTEGLKANQVDDYLKLATDLQREYQDDIKISVGFEIEYLSDYEANTHAFFEQYEAVTQHNILSVHYLKDDDGRYFGIDYSPTELANGISNDIDDPQRVYQRYLTAVLQSASVDWHHQQPLELGHISLIQKYQDYFQYPNRFNGDNCQLINQIVEQMQAHHLELDFNSAGLYKKDCNDFYPGMQILKQALNADIPIVFGSDAHSIDEVGRGWHLMNNLQKSLTVKNN